DAPRTLPRHPHRLPGALRLRGVRGGRPRAPVGPSGRHLIRDPPLALLRKGSEVPAREGLPAPRERGAALASSGHKRRGSVRIRRIPDLLAHRPRCELALALRAAAARADARPVPRNLGERGATDLRPLLDRRRSDLAVGGAAPLRRAALACGGRGPGVCARAARSQARRSVVARVGREGHAVLPAQLALVRRGVLVGRDAALRRAAGLPDALRLPIVPGEPARGSARRLPAAVSARASRAGEALAATRSERLSGRGAHRRFTLSGVAWHELAQFRRAARSLHQHLAVGRRALLLRIRRAARRAGGAGGPPREGPAPRRRRLRPARGAPPSPRARLRAARAPPDPVLRGAAPDPRANAPGRVRDALPARRDPRARRRTPRGGARPGQARRCPLPAGPAR